MSAAAPMFVIKPEDETVPLNGIAKFECVARGNPPPSVFWTKEGSQVLMFPGNNYGRMAVSSKGQLSVHGVLREDAGFIVCSALSVAGSAVARAFLQVSVFFLYLHSLERPNVLEGEDHVFFFFLLVVNGRTVVVTNFPLRIITF